MKSIVTAVGVLGLFAAGCSAADGSTTNGPGPATSTSDRTELQSELGTVTQKLGEATCGTIAADDTLDYTSTRAGAGTPDGNYGHPQCTDGYIVDMTNVPAGAQITGGMTAVRWPDPFSCLFNWGYVSLWQQSGSGYVKISESSALGFWGGLPQIGYVCFAHGTVTAPSAGNYRIVAAAGVLFGPKGAVSITR
jgi:hypothetical protein